MFGLAIVGIVLISYILGISTAKKIEKKYPKVYKSMCIGCGIPPDDDDTL